MDKVAVYAVLSRALVDLLLHLIAQPAHA